MLRFFSRLLVFGFASAAVMCEVEAAAAARVTFAGDVAPILFDRCGTCHHPNGSAPFTLLTYPAARQRATQIAAVTKSRLMPPWKSEPGYGEFIGHRPSPMELSKAIRASSLHGPGGPTGGSWANRISS